MSLFTTQLARSAKRTALSASRSSTSTTRRSLTHLIAPLARPTIMAPALDVSSRSQHTVVVDGPAGKVEADPNMGATNAGQPQLTASKLQVELTTSPREVPPSKSLIFGHTFSDHMLSIKWSTTGGWEAPSIHPYGPLNLDPSACIFHYAPSLFEGMKAYKDDNGKVRLFRPDMNMKRMISSAHRLALPTFEGQELIKLIARLVKQDEKWIPSEPGHSLYLRPALIGTQAALGIHPTTDALLFCITSPVGPYYSTGFKPVALEANPSRVRAWPGGTGQYKLGGNYAPGIRPQMEAATKGYQQILWLFGDEHWLTEVGAMNLFVVLRKADGIEIVTPPLNGMILPGVTRDSILALTRDHAKGTSPLPGLPENVTVSEREISMREVADAADKGDLLEMFGAGTAAIVSPVDRVGYNGNDIHVPVGDGGAGPVTKAVLERITDIQMGRFEHPWSVCIDDLL